MPKVVVQLWINITYIFQFVFMAVFHVSSKSFCTRFGFCLRIAIQLHDKMCQFLSIKCSLLYLFFEFYHVYKVNVEKSMTKPSGGCAVENNFSAVFICNILVTVTMFLRCKNQRKDHLGQSSH